MELEFDSIFAGAENKEEEAAAAVMALVFGDDNGENEDG